MSKKALFIAGGWGGHEPIETSKFIIQEIKKFDIESELVESLDVMSDLEYLKTSDEAIFLLTIFHKFGPILFPPPELNP